MNFNNLVHLEESYKPLKYPTVEYDINSSKQLSTANVDCSVLGHNSDGYN